MKYQSRLPMRDYFGPSIEIALAVVSYKMAANFLRFCRLYLFFRMWGLVFHSRAGTFQKEIGSPCWNGFLGVSHIGSRPVMESCPRQRSHKPYFSSIEVYL